MKDLKRQSIKELKDNEYNIIKEEVDGWNEAIIQAESLKQLMKDTELIGTKEIPKWQGKMGEIVNILNQVNLQ